MGTGLKMGQASGAVAGEPVGVEAGPSEIPVIGSQLTDRIDPLTITSTTPQAFR